MQYCDVEFLFGKKYIISAVEREIQIYINILRSL